MKKAVHLTTVHRPMDVRIFHKQAATLAAAGYDVSYVGQGDAGVQKGVKIVPLKPFASRLRRMTVGAMEAYRVARAQDADIYHFHDPELIGVGLLLKLNGKTVIYDVHEDVVKDLHDKRYLPGWSKPPIAVAVRLFEGLATAAFDQIVAATSAIAERFPKHKTTLVRNVPILNELFTAEGPPFAARSRSIVYIGGLAHFNGAEEMIRAMDCLPADAGIRLVLGGRFVSQQDEERLRALPGWRHVDYVGWVDRARMAEIMSDARAGLVVYQPTPNIMDCEPNKFFEVLSASLPLIASNLPHWSRFIAEHDCGVVVDPSDPQAIADAILKMVDAPEEAQRMGANGRAAVESGYNWDIDSARLIDLYDTLAPGRTSA